MVTTLEHDRSMRLIATRNEARTSDENSAEGEIAEEKRVSITIWFFIGLGALIGWGLGLAASLLVPIATFIVNFLIVLSIWFWAKTQGLKPPSFSSNLRKGGALVTKVVGNKNLPAGSGIAERIEEAVPGSDLLYIALGGIHPIAYLAALFINNR